MYRVEVSKKFGPYQFLVPLNALGNLGCSRDHSLPWSSGVQDNIEGIHEISRLMCEIWKKMSGGFLSLLLVYF